MQTARYNVSYRIGLCQFRLGRREEARETISALLDQLRGDPEGYQPGFRQAVVRLLEAIERVP